MAGYVSHMEESKNELDVKVVVKRDLKGESFWTGFICLRTGIINSLVWTQK
jgi:hypothetical protein